MADRSELKKKGIGFIEEFKNFVLKGNVMDMAIGVIIGTAFAGIVNALTEDFINPVINLLGGADVAGEVVIKTLSDGTKVSLNSLINPFPFLVISSLSIFFAIIRSSLNLL